MDLSIVLISYKMQRELPRTIQSLCRPYQQGIDDLTYEILVVENGDAPLPADEIRNGTPVRYMRPPSRSKSPVPALNAGISNARGTHIGAWIDGARLASPGLINAAIQASAHAARAVVATLNYQLGPTRQTYAAETGYSQVQEDQLLNGIDWENNGYKLFDIATPEMKTPDGALLETNALFLHRDFWQELGGFDPAFDEPGGGLANPDMLCRAFAAPDAQLIRIMGEGTFHQFHNGVTTSDPRDAAREVMRASKKYQKLRGHPPRQIREPGLLFSVS